MEYKMANEQNLLKGDEKHTFTLEEASKGGRRSAEARRAKRDLRQALEMLLEKEYKDKKGNVLSGTELITAKLFQQAMKGNIRAFETIRSTVGQDPVQKVEHVNISDETREQIERFLNDESEDVGIKQSKE
jgi:hypothetical protein